MEKVNKPTPKADSGFFRDHPASAVLVRQLQDAGLLSEAATERGLAMIRPGRAWWLWASRMLLLIGAALTLAGVISFFAYNWASLTGLHKLVLIQLCIIALVVAVQKRGRELLSGKVMMLGASVLAGVLLAVYSQVYQTGADAFELFIWWAVLILGWVAAAEFAGLWMVWLAVLYAGIILYWFQVLKPGNNTHYSWLCIALALLSALALFSREAGLRRGWDWLSGKWLRIVLLSALLIALMVPGEAIVFLPKHRANGNTVSLLLWAAALIAGYYSYRRIIKDMTALAVLAFSVCIIVLSVIGKFLFKAFHYEIFNFFAMGMIVIVVVSLAVVWLRWTARDMAGENDG